MDGGAGVGGDRITHPAGPLQLYGLKLYGRLCMQTGVVRKIRSAESPMGEKRSIKLRSSGDGKDPRGKSKLQPIGLEPTNPLPTLRIVGAPKQIIAMGPPITIGEESHRGLRLRCPYPDNNQKYSEHVCDGRDCHI